MPVTVRPARAEELQDIQELIVGSINDLTERHGFGAIASVRAASFQLFSLQDDPRGLWVAEDDGEVVGSAFSWTCGELWFLAELFIAPRMQGSGIGRELLGRTLSHAETTGAKTRALITFAFNTVSLGLYIRHGMFPRLPIYMMSGDRDDFPVTNVEAPLTYEPIGPADLATLATLDRDALGISRDKHHMHLLADPAVKGFLFREGEDNAGYAYAGYAYVASTGHIGPVAVTRPDIMGRVFDATLTIAAQGNSRQISAFLPGSCEAALDIAARRRMRITCPMVLLSDRAFGDWKRYLPRNPGFM